MASSSADADFDEEPMLKYQRLGSSLSEILASDAACCLGVHEKFLALGTRKGVVHILDLNGNAIQRFAPHSAAVNDICVDRTGEFVGSCSQDGTVVISSMYGAEASTHWYHRPVCAIALDGEYSVRRVFTTGGLAGQLVLNTKGWFGAKDAIIHAGEGPVRAIRSRGGLIAWANDAGVKVYDARNKERVSYVERPADAPLAERFRPHLLWHASGADGGSEPTTELLIGWADSVKIGRLRAREGIGPATVDRTRYYLEVVSIIQTDCYVAGLAVASVRPERTLSGAFHEDILLLAYVCEPADEEERGAGEAPPDGALRPEMRLLSRRNEELSADALSIVGFENLRTNDYALALAPMAAGDGGGGAAAAAAAGGDDEALALPPELTAYIVSPTDIVIARSRDWDDRLSWLLQRAQYEEAVALARRQQGALHRHRLADVAQLHLGDLLANGEAARAAELCPSYLGGDAAAWKTWVRRFADANAMPLLAPLLPTAAPQLAPEEYETALSALAVADAAALLGRLKAWAPTLYRVDAVQGAVARATAMRAGGGGAADHLEQPLLMEAAAMLHTLSGQHDAALTLLLGLPPGQMDVCAAIARHNLQPFLRGRIAALAAHGWPAVLALLLDATDTVRPADVVAQLGAAAQPERTLDYLHGLFEADAAAAAPFAEQQLRLYAAHRRDDLLPFLRQSDHYPLRAALSICEEFAFLDGEVFVLHRMGDNHGALARILERSSDGNLDGAIAFVQEVVQETGDDELWQRLLTHAMATPTLTAALLDHVGRAPLAQLAPLALIQALPADAAVDNLRAHVTRLLVQSRSRLELAEQTLAVCNAEVAELARERHRQLQAGEVHEARPMPRRPRSTDRPSSSSSA